jgi:hypothetical protein
MATSDGIWTVYVHVLHLKGDMQDFEFVKTSLAAKGYDVVYDINGNISELNSYNH